MDFYILWILSSIGLFTVVASVLVTAWVLLSLWRFDRATKRQAEREVEQRVSEPAPLSPKVEREIAAILDGDDYEWVWRDAI
jgi:type VI protein secretion system component VasK